MSVEIQKNSIEITQDSHYKLNLRSQVIGDINIDISQYLTKKQLRFLSPVASLCAIAMSQAVANSGSN
jgi:3-oxoacyl-(acyl-carrier-protein) synthase